MLATTILIRELPLLIFRKPIKNKYVNSFLYYVPYVTLTVMTFPAILHVTDNPIIGTIALVGGIILAYFKVDMFIVALISAAAVFGLQFIF